MKTDVVELTRELISFPSVSLSSNVAAARHAARVLRACKFEVEEVPYTDENGVEKLSLAARLGKGRGGLSLMSHIDVVPAAIEDGWSGNPFEGRLQDGKIYGRGSCDMKGPLAATLCAASRFKAADLQAPLYVMITADEERHAMGARLLVDKSRLFKEARSGYGLICEPTRLRVVYAHKGSLSMCVTSKGRPAHTSTTKGVNANIKMIPFLNDMLKIRNQVLTSNRFRNNDFNPPYSDLNITVNDHNIAINIFPAQSTCYLLYRPMPGVDTEALVRRVKDCASKRGVKCQVRRGGLPLYTPPDSALVRTALKLSGTRTPSTVSYGTDGMAYTRGMKQLVVLGPGDIAQAHTADEWVSVDQLHKAVDLYTRFIDHVCVRNLP